MSAGSLFFAACSLIAVVGALLTILARNPIRSAVGLLGTVTGMAGLFLELRAEFMAAIQLIVYAGAVVVLFVFVIMLLGPDAGAAPTGVPKARLARFAAGVLVLLMATAGIVLVAGAHSQSTPLPEVRPDHGTVEAVGHQLFTLALVPFELATVLLTVAVVGAIAVARGRPQKRQVKAESNPTRRLFHGPLHPRDAGRPLPKAEPT